MAPNILLILIDDLGWRDLGCYGSTFYETPQLDRLASQGMLFTNGYASCPVCSPTRASIMSGRYPARVGITQFIGGHYSGRLADVPYLHYLPLSETSVASALREGGYQTWHVGKWHLGDEPFYPEKHGFDVNIGGWHAGSPAGPNHYFPPYNNPKLKDGPPGEYLTDRLTDEAITLIRHRDKARPFFLNLCHYAVHTPLLAPAPLVEKYKAKAARLKLDQINPLVEGHMVPKLYGPNETPERVRRRILQSHPVYAAMIENLDTNIGRVLATLEAEGWADNTMVIFTSDNGGLATTEGSPTCNLPLAEGKGWNQEGGTRVCQIVRWKGTVKPGSRCATPTTSPDYYPTFLEAAGLPLRPQQHCDGLSLMPLLRGGHQLDREAIYWHYPHYANQGSTPAGSILSADGRWKLIEYFEDGRVELYDLTNDISETRNLSTTNPDMAHRLLGMLRAWQQDVSAKMPEPNPLWPKTPNNAHE